jgi:hypothetical protein
MPLLDQTPADLIDWTNAVAYTGRRSSGSFDQAGR